MKSVAYLALLPLLAATPVLADTTDAITAPSQVAPSQVAPVPAPLTNPWNDVSHINGQLVPVGQHTDYLYDFKRFNISSNPVGWVVGIYGLSVEYAMTSNLALRADGNYFSFDHGTTTGYEVGISLPIYLRRTFSGPFLEPGVMARNLSGTTTAGPEVMFGWHWSFDSGLNVAAALGVGRDLNSQNMDDSDLVPAGYFRVGYEF